MWRLFLVVLHVHHGSFIAEFFTPGINGVRRNESARQAPAADARRNAGQSVAREMTSDETKHLFASSDDRDKTQEIATTRATTKQGTAVSAPVAAGAYVG